MRPALTEDLDNMHITVEPAQTDELVALIKARKVRCMVDREGMGGQDIITFPGASEQDKESVRTVFNSWEKALPRRQS